MTLAGTLLAATDPQVADLADYLGVALMLGSIVWVYRDAHRVGTRGLEPAAWALGCLLLWIAFMPLYLVMRWRTKRGHFPARSEA